MIELFWYLAHVLLLHIITSFQAITNLGGRMLGNFDHYSDIYILIVDAYHVKTASHKFIWAQANGAPIVTLDYITASEAHGSFLETGPFEVGGQRLTDREFLDSLQLGSFPKHLSKPTGSTKKPEICATQLKLA